MASLTILHRLQAREGAEQWQKRAQQLQQKYGKVDLAEHQRVQEALAAVQAELAQLRTAAEARQAQLQKDLDKVGACAGHGVRNMFGHYDDGWLCNTRDAQYCTPPGGAWLTSQVSCRLVSRRKLPNGTSLPSTPRGCPPRASSKTKPA